MAFMISRIGQHRGPIRLAPRWQQKCKDLLPFGSARSIAQIVSTTFTPRGGVHMNGTVTKMLRRSLPPWIAAWQMN
jgi:hypothetical protein